MDISWCFSALVMNGVRGNVLKVFVLLLAYRACFAEDHLDCRMDEKFEDGRCEPCPRCPAGSGLPKICGFGSGAHQICQPCLPGTYNDASNSTEICKPCVDCKAQYKRELKQQCNKDRNAECGGCLPGYYDRDKNLTHRAELYTCQRKNDQPPATIASTTRDDVVFGQSPTASSFKFHVPTFAITEVFFGALVLGIIISVYCNRSGRSSEDSLLWKTNGLSLCRSTCSGRSGVENPGSASGGGIALKEIQVQNGLGPPFRASVATAEDKDVDRGQTTAGDAVCGTVAGAAADHRPVGSPDQPTTTTEGDPSRPAQEPLEETLEETTNEAGISVHFDQEESTPLLCEPVPSTDACPENEAVAQQRSDAPREGRAEGDNPTSTCSPPPSGAVSVVNASGNSLVISLNGEITILMPHVDSTPSSGAVDRPAEEDSGVDGGDDAGHIPAPDEGDTVVKRLWSGGDSGGASPASSERRQSEIESSRSLPYPVQETGRPPF